MNKYERNFFNVVSLMLLISLATMTMILLNTGQLPLILPLLSLPIIYWAQLQLKSEKPLYLSRMAGNLLALISMLFVFMQEINIFNPLSTILYFLFILLYIKLLQRKKNRDYLQLLLFSLAFMLISAVYQPAIWFLGIFIAYIVVGLWVLIMLHFKKEAEGEHSPDKKPVLNIDNPAFGKVFRKGFFFFISSLSVLTIVITTLGFLSMPRFRTGWFSPIMPQMRSSSGLSETVQLGGGGKIELDNSRALYVTWDEMPNTEILYRAVAQPKYSPVSRRWTADESNSTRFKFNDVYVDITDDVSLENEKRLGSISVNIIDQQYNRTVQRFVTPGLPKHLLLLEPKEKWIGAEYPAMTIMSKSPLFEPNVVYNVDVLKSPKKHADFWDAIPEKRLSRFQDEPQYKEKYLKFIEDNCPPKEGESGWNARRIQRLTDVLSNAPFSYTLDQPDIPYKRSPIDYFLFEGHAGHCEYFASALAMLLQTAGVDAHVVTGYASNPANLQKISGKWVDDVRYKQAHAWVEVKFEDWGWVPFNPTPGGYIPQYEEMSGYDRFMSMIQYKYQRYVLDFSIEDQQSIARDIKGSISSLGDDVEEMGNDILAYILGDNKFPTWLKMIIGFTVFIVPIIGLYLIVKFIRKRFRINLKQKTRVVDSLEFEFKQVLRMLEKIRRNPRSASETFAEIINTSKIQQLVDDQSICWLRDVYWEIRFNDATLNEETQSKLRSFLHKIKEQRKLIKLNSKTV